MTAKQFEKRVSSVLERKYRKYNITGFKVWKEGKHLFLSVRIGVDLIRTEPWGVSAVFDSEGKWVLPQIAVLSTPSQYNLRP